MKKYLTMQRIDEPMEDSILNQMNDMEGWELLCLTHANSMQNIYTYVFVKEIEKQEIQP